jgi:hypothetical protein
VDRCPIGWMSASQRWYYDPSSRDCRDFQATQRRSFGNCFETFHEFSFVAELHMQDKK